MTKTIFKIDDLWGYAWNCAIRNIYKVLNENIKIEPLDLRDILGYEEIAREFNINFDVDGNIIKNNKASQYRLYRDNMNQSCWSDEE